MLKPRCLLIALVSLQTVFAQTEAPPTVVDTQKAELIRKIFASDGFDKLGKQIETQTLSRTFAVMGQNPLFPRPFLQELAKRMSERVGNLDLQAMLLPIYAKHFSTDELQQILAFESSPVGQKLRSSEASMLADIQPEVSMWSRKTGQEATRQILNDHPEWARQIAENRQKQNADMLATAPADNGKASEPAHWNTRDVTPPQVISKSEPQFTEEARKAKASGSVGISLTVGSDGLPKDVRVIRPLGFGLDEKAIEAVQSWRWKPATKNGVPVATHAMVDVNFRILDKPPVNN